MGALFRIIAGAVAVVVAGALALPAGAQMNSITRSGLELSQTDIELMGAAAQTLYVGRTANGEWKVL